MRTALALNPRAESKHMTRTSQAAALSAANREGAATSITAKPRTCARGGRGLHTQLVVVDVGRCPASVEDKEDAVGRQADAHWRYKRWRSRPARGWVTRTGRGCDSAVGATRLRAPSTTLGDISRWPAVERGERLNTATHSGTLLAALFHPRAAALRSECRREADVVFPPHDPIRCRGQRDRGSLNRSDEVEPMAKREDRDAIAVDRSLPH